MLNWKSRLHNYLSKRHQFSQNNHSISDKFDTNHFLYIKKNLNDTKHYITSESGKKILKSYVYFLNK